MRRYDLSLQTALVLLVSLNAVAGTSFKANTTLAAETANNTSAANTFATQTNGNLGATNISKLPTRSLLYPGSTAKIYVHLMPWFGFGNHMNVGYTSNDPTQVQRQLNDMVSRGLDGVIIDWFGQGTLDHGFAAYSQVVQDFMQDAEQQPNFNFAIMDDAGSLKTCAATAGCDLTQTLINDLTYAYSNWENSPAYLHYNNQPVVYFFGEEAYTLAVLFADLPRDRAAVTSLPPPGPAPAVRIGMAAPVLVGVLVSLVVFTYSQHSLHHHPAFAALGPNSHPLVPILVVLLVIGCLARRRHRRDRQGQRFDDHEDV